MIAMSMCPCEWNMDGTTTQNDQKQLNWLNIIIYLEKEKRDKQKEQQRRRREKDRVNIKRTVKYAN